MSLNWNVENVKDRDTSEEGWQITQALIWSTITAGIGKITEDNAAEFFIRCKMWADLDGYPIFSYADVLAHAGLSTNVTTETRAQWLRRFGKLGMDYAVTATAKKAQV